MIKLKRYVDLWKRNLVTDEDRDDFKTIGFDPEELLQLKDMNTKELTGLMCFCGIRVFNGVPLIVLTEDEMREAYLVWRADKINSKKEEVSVKLERGIRWLRYLSKAVETMTR